MRLMKQKMKLEKLRKDIDGLKDEIKKSNKRGEAPSSQKDTTPTTSKTDPDVQAELREIKNKIAELTKQLRLLQEKPEPSSKLDQLMGQIEKLRTELDQKANHTDPTVSKSAQNMKKELEEALRQIEALLKTQTEQEQKIKGLEDQLREAQRQVQNSTEGVPVTMAPIAQGIKQAMQAVSDPELAGSPQKIQALEEEIARLKELLNKAPQNTSEEQTAKSELEEALRQIEALLKTQTEQEQKNQESGGSAQ